MKENEKTWKKDGDNQLTERQKKEIKNMEKQAQARRKSKTEEKQKQKRINETWKLLPAHEQRQLIKEEEKRRLLELREMKLNIWKKWRREPEEKRKETEAKQRNNQDLWLEKLEETVARMKREIEDRKVAQQQVEERRRKLLEEKKAKQEEILRKDYERKERKQKQKMMGERWAMARWISSYIDENKDKWEREKLQRQKTDLERAEEWKKMKRFEKIALMREKMEEKKANLSLAVTTTKQR